MTADHTCRWGVERLMDYLEGVLGAAERAVIDAHMAGCPRCVAFVEGYVATPRIWRAVTATAPSTETAAALRRFLAARR